MPQYYKVEQWMRSASLHGSFGLAPTPPPILYTNDQIVKCPLCLEPYREPKVLACFHSFCKPCLQQQLETNEKIVCPACQMETQLSVTLGLDSLLSDFGLENVLANSGGHFHLDDKFSNPMAGLGSVTGPLGVIGVPSTGGPFGSPSSTSSTPPLSDSPSEGNGTTSSSLSSGPGSLPRPPCTGCKSGERASAYCQECCSFLCTNCTMAHQYMHCFDGHRVEPLSTPAAQLALESVNANRVSCKCLQHRNQPLRYFCLTCNLTICTECTIGDHAAPSHHYADIDEVAEMQIGSIEGLVNDARNKQSELLEMFKTVDSAQNRLNHSLARAHAVLDENIQQVIRILEDQRKQLAKDIETVYSAKQLRLTMVDKRIQQMSDKLAQTIEFTSRLIKHASPTEVMVFKQLLDTRLQMFLTFNPDNANVLSAPSEVELPSMNLTTTRLKLSGLLGQVKPDSAEWSPTLGSALSGMPPTPIGRPPSRHQLNPLSTSVPHGSEILRGTPPASSFLDMNPMGMSLPRPVPSKQGSPPADILLGSSVNSIGGMCTPFGSATSDGLYQNYDKWSSALEPSIGITEVSELDMDKTAFCPPRSQIKRQKMIYHCKFGEFGVMEGQFTEPSGVAVNSQGDIVVADTNNHRIQVFDKEGRFKFQFGECGKRDGQLLYPNRVAVNKTTGDFIVTERSPTHQIQVYNQYGQFLRKFGANILQHPRGVCVDSKGRIIVVECKVMRVIIFDMYGNILQKFSCSRYLEFPNGVCTNDKNEILISDNRAHCIKVFSYEGQFVRQIGGEGVTNYPIGVGITTTGEVVVADNHNNFNLTVFGQDGQMIGALESKVKHAQCFDVALVDDGSVVLASKDYRLYLYRFANGAMMQ